MDAAGPLLPLQKFLGLSRSEIAVVVTAYIWSGFVIAGIAVDHKI